MLCCNIYLYPKERPWHRTVFFKLENFNVLLQHDSMPRKRRNWISLWIKVKNKYLMKRQYPACSSYLVLQKLHFHNLIYLSLFRFYSVGSLGGDDMLKYLRTHALMYEYYRQAQEIVPSGIRKVLDSLFTSEAYQIVNSRYAVYHIYISLHFSMYIHYYENPLFR